MLLRLIYRYSFSLYNRHFRSSVKISLTYALTLFLITIIMAVMASLQSQRFDSIRDVKSFDITVENGDLEEIESLYPDASVFSYSEGYALINGRAFIIRYVDESYDGGINILFGDDSGLILSYSSYMALSNIVRLSRLGGNRARRSLDNIDIAVSGVFNSSMGSSFDSYYAFLPKSYATSFDKEYVAIKGCDDTSALDSMKIGYETWKEKEATLYSAFMLERYLMLLVLFVLLLIVYIELRQEARIFLRNKKNEAYELFISGLEDKKIAFVFILSFLLILFSGALLALLASYLAVPILSSFMRMSFSYYKEVNIDLKMFIIINVAFYIITSLTVFSFFKRSFKKSIREGLDE